MPRSQTVESVLAQLVGRLRTLRCLDQSRLERSDIRFRTDQDGCRHFNLLDDHSSVEVIPTRANLGDGPEPVLHSGQPEDVGLIRRVRYAVHWQAGIRSDEEGSLGVLEQREVLFGTNLQPCLRISVS